MRALLLGLALASSTAGSAAARDAQEGCVVCHGKEAKQFERGLHARLSFGCVDCHGGDPDALETAAAHTNGFLSLKDPRAAVERCASCHSDSERMQGYGLRTDQAQIYWTSAHGRALAEGHLDVATCVQCHGDHAIFRSTDPRSPIHKFSQPETCGRCHANAELMDRYGLSAEVVDEYRGSVHGKALLSESRLSSPTCSDCHSSHGATPPRTDVVGRVCGQCHAIVLRYFEESPHLEPVREGEIEECISCHGSHAVARPTGAMFMGEGRGHCATCHRDSDDPAREVAREIHGALDELDTDIAEAESAIRAAAADGLFIEREHGFLDDARSLRGRARSVTHSLSPAALSDIMNRGRAMTLETHESLAVKQRVLRDRKIFTAIFLGVTLLLAAVLQTYRREIYGGWKPAGEAPRGGEPSGRG